MWFKKLAAWIKGSGKVNGKRKVVYLGSSKMTSHKKNKAGHDKRADWSNTSGLYRKLSDRQKQYLDKITDIMDREDQDH